MCNRKTKRTGATPTRAVRPYADGPQEDDGAFETDHKAAPSGYPGSHASSPHICLGRGAQRNALPRAVLPEEHRDLRGAAVRAANPCSR